MGDGEARYNIVPTEIEGVELRVATGTKTNVPREITELFHGVAAKFVASRSVIEAETEAQKKRRSKLIQFVESIPGLRGIRSLAGDFGLLLVRKEKTSWDRDLLRASLGAAYSPLVSEELVATISIPAGLTSEEQLRAGLAKLLEGLQVPAADVAKLLKTEVTLRIDVEKLDELTGDGRVKLLPGSKNVGVEWAVEVNALKEPQTAKRPAKGKKSGG